MRPTWGRGAEFLRTSAEDQRGAVAVELALVLPVLMTIVLGVITGGMVLNRQLSVSHAAREAARYGAVLPADECEPVTACDGATWAALVRSVAMQRAGDDVTAAQVCVALVRGSGTAPVAVDTGHTTAGGSNACYVDGSIDTGLRVQVQIARGDRIELFGANVPVTVNARATARAEV